MMGAGGHFNIEIFRRSVDSNGAVVISDNEFFGDLSMDPAPRPVCPAARR